MPAHIARPEYVDRPAPQRFTGEEVKDAETIERMRVASRLAAQARDLVGSHVVPGVTTDELDRIGHEFLCDHGAYPSTLGYRGFPKSLCSSINEVVCHGIPDDTVVRDGDIVNIDITAYLDGVHGDTNATFLAGEVDEETRLLVERTKEALERGIKAVKPGRRIDVIGRVIESYARRFGYGVVREFTGLHTEAGTAPVLVVDRSGWLRANADGFAKLLSPVVDKLIEKKGPPSAFAEGS